MSLSAAALLRTTMSNNNTTKYTPEALCKRITTLTKRGATAELAFPKVAKETGHTIAAVQHAYYHAGRLVTKHHGNWVLTKEQEELMTCLLIVLSLVHKSLSNWDIISKASIFLDLILDTCGSLVFESASKMSLQ